MRNILSALLLASLSIFAVTGAWADVKGGFRGASDHVTTGSVTIEKNDDGSHTLHLSADFSLDGAPDPRVGFGKDGAFFQAADLGELQSLTGAQSYHVPANLDISNFNEVYIWCLKFSVPLGVATLG